jgi:hypothetical protein
MHCIMAPENTLGGVYHSDSILSAVIPVWDLLFAF